ncbi:MAG: peptidoglycan DD-metalloendopeptidase family protein [Lamprocystis purpurea]|jgi:septal ring factor EnvC (AmiA/AmiB activator)|nr:peptidoglycan DD-metalloendopeptidase family protein [Lamprocystis purpurea]
MFFGPHQRRSRLPRRGRWCRAVAAAHLACGLAAGFAAAHAPTIRAQETDTVIDARSRDLSDLDRQMEGIGAELTGQNAERQALIAELEQREKDVAALAIAGRELDRVVGEQTRVAQELRVRESQAQTALAEQTRRLAESLRTAYAMGRTDGLRMLLNQEDPVRASRVLSYFAYFNRERVRGIQAVEASAARLTRLAGDAEREAGRLREFALEQEAARVRLEAAKQERAQVLAALEQTIVSREADLVSLGRDAENLRLLVEHLRQRAQIQAELEIRRDPFATRQGRLAWPLLEGRIRAGFGTQKPDSDSTWDGCLLAAREGEEVRTIYDGRVVYADWLVGFGLLLVIDHGDGFMSFYGHNEALLKDVGEWVSAAEVIALSGNSGGRDEPVLYFAIRHHGEALDPTRWCG